ncbi:MAG: DUF4340 domain-containing protein [Polyangiaceae bacterium]
MSRDKLILAGVIVLGLLGVMVFQQAKKDEALGRPAMTATDFPTVSAPDDIDKLSITNGDKGEVVLQKVPDPKGEATDAGPATMWVMTKPVNAPANQQAAKDIVGNLKDIKVESQINLKLDDEVKKEKQLDSAKGVHVVASKGGAVKADDLFWKSGTAGQLVIASSKPDTVWAAKGYSAFLYTKEAKDFRDKEVLKFDDDKASSIGITNAHGTFAFAKTDKWGGTFDKKPIARFDAEKVKDFLRAFKGLSADDFGDGKTAADTGLDKPEATVTITSDGKPYELLIGKVSTGTNRWAKRATDDTIYQITNYASEWGLADSAKFQSTADAGAPDAAAPKGGKK